MAWNEPGGDKKDPWGKNDQQPPDLDEVIRNLQKKISRFFGGKDNNANKNNASGGSGLFLLAIAAVIGVFIWIASSFYLLQEQEQAVVLRLGKFHSVIGPGLNFEPRMIDVVYKQNVTALRIYKTQGLMLTEDENIIDVSLSVQYNINDIKAYVLGVRDPEHSLMESTDSALRHVVGSSAMYQVLSSGRAKVAEDIKVRLQSYLDSYGTGINVLVVNIQDAKPPAGVKAAFDDVIKAREDEERLKNEAQAYANGIIPEARGRAMRIVQDAEAYRGKIIAQAEGEASRFEQLLTEYKKAPGVTRERLYIETLESVLGNNAKVLVDVEGGNNMMYLPLDQLLKNAGKPRVAEETSASRDRQDQEDAYQQERSSQPRPTRSGGVR